MSDTLLAGEAVFETTSSFIVNPSLELLMLTALVSLALSLMSKYFTPQDEIRELKNNLRALSKEFRANMDNTSKAQKIQKDMFQVQSALLKRTINFRQMLMTALPMILLLMWVKQRYESVGILFDIGILQFAWLGSYILFSIGWTIIWRRLLDLA